MILQTKEEVDREKDSDIKIKMSLREGMRKKGYSEAEIDEKHPLNLNEEEKIDFFVRNLSLEKLKPIVMQNLVSNDKDTKNKGYDMIVRWILYHNYIYTTRHDERAEMWIYNEGVYVPEGRTYITELVEKIMGIGFNTNSVRKVIDRVEAKTYIDPEKFFDTKNIETIAVMNGLLNVVSRELRSFTPKEIYFNKLPVYYDETKSCPAIKKFLNSVVKHDEDVSILQELSGYLLYKQYKIEKAFMFTGTGRNGKGKTIELFKRLIGPENCVNIPIQKLEDEFYVSELHNKLANLGADINSQSLKDTGLFKGLTGRDMVSANRKFKNQIHFENYAKMVFCANELPRTEDVSNAFFMRWVIIEFPYEFLPTAEMSGKPYQREQDTDIIDKITTEDELSGMLNWALVGLTRLFDRRTFTNSQSCDTIKQQWIRKSDSLRSFCMDMIEEDFEGRIGKKEFLYAYVQYCKLHKLKVYNEKVIKSVLQMDYGVMESRINMGYDKVSFWEGISFTTKTATTNKTLNIEVDNKDRVFHTYTKNSKFNIELENPVLPVRPFNQFENEVEEELVSDTIFHKCSNCGTDTSTHFDEKGKPWCDVCFEARKINK